MGGGMGGGMGGMGGGKGGSFQSSWNNYSGPSPAGYGANAAGGYGSASG